MGGCLSGARAPGRPGRLDLPVGSGPRAPLDPQPELHAASLTVGPGETATFDLQSSPPGSCARTGRDPYAVDYSAAVVPGVALGSTVTIVGADRALPGAEEAAIVTVTSHPDVAPGPADPACRRRALDPAARRLGHRISAPRPPGPRARSGHRRRGRGQPAPAHPARGHRRAPNRRVRGSRPSRSPPRPRSSRPGPRTRRAPRAPRPSRCATRRAAARAPSATGSSCSICRDSPRPPPASSQTAYADGSVTLRVDPGNRAWRTPRSPGFVIRSERDGSSQCGADGVVPRPSRAQRRATRLRSLRRQRRGQSRTSVRTVAWAYDAPPAPTRSSPRPVVTGGRRWRRRPAIDGIDPDQTGSIEVASPDRRDRPAAGRRQARRSSTPLLPRRNEHLARPSR